MLLVAIPKSASTALMETLARAHGLACDMHKRWDGPESAEFPAFHLQHSFGWELDADTAAALCRSPTLFKLHIVPSTNNLGHLKPYKKIVLLRDPAGIIGAYKRGEETGVYRQKTRLFDGCVSLEDWLARSREIGIYQDMERFCARWRQAAGEHLLVDFDDMVADTATQIARIEAYLDLQPSGTHALLKRKYTRLGDRSLAYHRATADRWKISSDG